jgi:hypothetical protein
MSTQNLPYLFYSKRCPNSRNIIETLKGLNKASLYKFVEVESLTPQQIQSLPFRLAKVPTLYVPTTKEAVVGQAIMDQIAKSTNSRNDLPTEQPAQPGSFQPWGFEGIGKLTESYSSWNAPGTFTTDGAGSGMYTMWAGGGGAVPPSPASENTLKEKAGSNDDVKRRMEEMEKQRETEFSQLVRK